MPSKSLRLSGPPPQLSGATLRWNHGRVLRQYCIGMELIFEVRDAQEGGYYARALGYAIFTEGDTWEGLRANVLEAAALHFEDGPVCPRVVQLHYVKDEQLPLEAA
jgi:hypothetical protein